MNQKNINFTKIEDLCIKTNKIYEVADEQFLMPYTVRREKLDRKLVHLLFKYQKVMNTFEKKIYYSIMGQMTYFLIHKKDGYLSRYLNHPEFRKRSEEEINYFKFSIENPCRFSFCVFKESPFENFHIMVDVLSHEEFLLYSPNLQFMIKDGIRFFLLLLTFNGECYQTQGQMFYFKGIQPPDIYFYLDILDSESDSFQEIIDNDPLPFILLCSGSELPSVFARKHEMIFHQAEYDFDDFDITRMLSKFTMENVDSIYKFTLIKWNEFPHFAHCYFDFKTNKLVLFSHTREGFDQLIKAMNKLGFDVDEYADDEVTPMFIATAEKILGKEIRLNSYEEIFKQEEEPSEELKKMNNFVNILVNLINGKKKYDLKEIALEANIDFKIAKEFEKGILNSINKL